MKWGATGVKWGQAGVKWGQIGDIGETPSRSLIVNLQDSQVEVALVAAN